MRGLDGVQPIAGSDVLELHEHRPCVRLDHRSDGAAPDEGCMKTPTEIAMRCRPPARPQSRTGPVTVGLEMVWKYSPLVSYVKCAVVELV